MAIQTQQNAVPTFFGTHISHKPHRQIDRRRSHKILPAYTCSVAQTRQCNPNASVWRKRLFWEVMGSTWLMQKRRKSGRKLRCEESSELNGCQRVDGMFFAGYA
jgi:hypothetical protein